MVTLVSLLLFLCVLCILTVSPTVSHLYKQHKWPHRGCLPMTPTVTDRSSHKLPTYSRIWRSYNGGNKVGNFFFTPASATSSVTRESKPVCSSYTLNWEDVQKVNQAQVPECGTHWSLSLGSPNTGHGEKKRRLWLLGPEGDAHTPSRLPATRLCWDLSAYAAQVWYPHQHHLLAIWKMVQHCTARRILHDISPTSSARELVCKRDLNPL